MVSHAFQHDHRLVGSGAMVENHRARFVSITHRSEMSSKCPACGKPVYFAEKVTSLGKDWHPFCLKCAKCKKNLTSGKHSEHEGKPYCDKPCYAALFGPSGYGAGGQSYKYD